MVQVHDVDRLDAQGDLLDECDVCRVDVVRKEEGQRCAEKEESHLDPHTGIIWAGLAK